MSYTSVNLFVILLSSCQSEISLVELTTDLDDFFASHNYLIFQTSGGPCMMINLTTSAIFYTNYIRSETGL